MISVSIKACIAGRIKKLGFKKVPSSGRKARPDGHYGADALRGQPYVFRREDSAAVG